VVTEGSSTDAYGFALSTGAITGAISTAGSLLATGLTVGSSLNLQQQQQAHDTEMVKKDQDIAKLQTRTADAQLAVETADTTIAQDQSNQTLYTMAGLALGVGALAGAAIGILALFRSMSKHAGATEDDDEASEDEYEGEQ